MTTPTTNHPAPQSSGTSQASVYAAIHEPGDVTTVTDGDLVLYDEPLDETMQNSQATPWASVWYEDETYADSCHASSDEVYVAHYDWSLWWADLKLDIGRADDLDLISLATEVRIDADHLGDDGRYALLNDAGEFVADASEWLHDLRGLDVLGMTARDILDNGFRPVTLEVDDITVAPALSVVSLTCGDVVAQIRSVSSDARRRGEGHWTIGLQLVDVHQGLTSHAAASELFDSAGIPAAGVNALAIEVPLEAITAIRTGPWCCGEDGRIHFIGDTCLAPHQVSTDPNARDGETPTEVLTCGQDFMAGTICSKLAGHGGPDAAECLWCSGDWVNETCVCPTPGDGEDSAEDE